MWQRIARLFPRGKFARRLAWITGGTLVGQILLVGAMPLLTRIYSLEDFGLFAVLGALNGIFGIVMACRYEFAIPLVAKDDDAAALVVLGALVALFLSLVSALLVWGLGDALAELTDLPALVPLLWLLPPILLITGLGQLFEYWSIRRETLKLNGASRVVQFGGQAVSQSVLGFAGTGAMGLTVGYGLGYVARLILFVVALPTGDRAAIAAARLPQIRHLAQTFLSYPTYSTASSLLRSATQFLPTIIFAALYGPAVAGGFDLAQRLLTVPVRLLSGAASQVFLLEAAQRSAKDVLKLFMRTLPRFLVLGIAGMAPLLLAGPWLFALLFGEPWREAGSFAQALVAYQLTRFVAVPVSQAFNVFGRQDLEFHTSLLNGMALIVSFALIIWTECQSSTAVWLYSGASAISQAAMLWLAWRMTRRAAKSDLPVSRSARE
jgi:O-antigen/teichoic acid export membrane protein